MEYLVIAEFKTNPGSADDLAALFREALPVTRAFAGCKGIDVYFEAAKSTYTLIENWESLDHYEAYLQFRTDSGIAELLDPILDGGWQGVVDGVKRLGQPTAL